MKVYVTGIGGFLGGAMAADLRAAGHTVDGSRRDTALDLLAFDNLDALIHAAHDFTPGAAQRNIDLTTVWFQAARARGVPYQIFLSSCSAGSDSEYGRIKQAIEPLFLRAGQCVVRPGLVLGDGGLFRRQRAAILRSPIIPMIGRGAQPTAVIPLDRFLAALRIVLERRLSGTYNLYEVPMPTYRDLVTRVKQEANQPARFLNIPAGFALAATTFLEHLHIPFPIKPGQIRALTAGPAGASRLAELFELRDEAHD